jgi:hypothetical protein
MSRHAGDGGLEPVEGLNDANCAEQAGDDVIGAAKIEVHHDGADIVARRILQARSAEIALIDIDAIDRVVLFEEFCMLAGAASNIEDRARAGRSVIAGIRRARRPIDLSTSDTILSVFMFKSDWRTLRLGGMLAGAKIDSPSHTEL